MGGTGLLQMIVIYFSLLLYIVVYTCFFVSWTYRGAVGTVQEAEDPLCTHDADLVAA